MEGTKLSGEQISNIIIWFVWGLLTLPLGKCDKYSIENSYHGEDNCYCLISTEKYLKSQYLKEFFWLKIGNGEKTKTLF